MQPIFYRNRMIQRLLGCFTLLLLVVTHALWGSPPTVDNPQIPWFAWGIDAPFGVDICSVFLLSTASLGLCLFSMRNRTTRAFFLIYTISFSILILLDQHRLQPWVLQFLLMTIVLGLSKHHLGMKCCRWIVLTIYFYSALSKLDTSFYESHGQLLLDGLLKAVHIDGSFWSDNFRNLLAMLFPLGELLIVSLLLFRRTCRCGVVFSWVMHSAIILAVGPLGLNHEFGVLLWNVYFILQNYILFWAHQDKREEEATLPPSRIQIGNRLAVSLTILFAVLPVLENWGWYDHWPAWAVYSSRSESVVILVDQEAAEEFPNFLKELCGRPILFEEKVPVSLDRWSFEKRNCPIYPQMRYRLALAKALIQEWTSEDEIEFKIESTPQRWTGERETITLVGWSELERYLSATFYLNTKARRVSADER